MAAFADHGVTGNVIRIADHDVKPGVEVRHRDGDAWPDIRQDPDKTPEKTAAPTTTLAGNTAHHEAAPYPASA
ncbi:hypothetical protein ABZ957_05895 [Streptomyces sp. NPDC046316]|uniref:hypothetical protein n=1 Tax=Streptomyces sp. NPDC046316 TaxID=3154494 RepID=UPI0033D3B6CF